MNNNELKKKILSIVRGAILEADELPFIETTDNIADALIAAGIGDVKEAEMAANRYEMLYKLQNRDMALAERRAHDAEHRAEVAENELKLYKFAVKIWQERYSDIRCFNFNIALKQAEKELAEENDGKKEV